jgi:hypothetical protein
MFNVGTLKTLSYLTSFGLLGGIGYSLYDYYEHGQHENYFDRERAKEVLNGVKEPVPAVAKGLNYQDDIKPAIVDANWTGAPPPPPPAPVEEGPVEPVEQPVIPVDDILDVIGIIAASDDPASSRCLVRMVDSPTPGSSDLWLYTGDDLPAPHDHIAILSIKPQQVTFSFEDEEREPESIRPHARSENSLIAKADENGVVAPLRPSIVGSAAASPGAITPLRTLKKKGQYYIGTEDANSIANDYDQILSRDVSSETYYDENGKRAGIKLTRVASDSIAAQHGAQAGDVIKSINGYPVNSKQEAISFAKKNADRYEIWEIEVENLGRTRTEVYHSPKD